MKKIFPKILILASFTLALLLFILPFSGKASGPDATTQVVEKSVTIRVTFDTPAVGSQACKAEFSTINDKGVVVTNSVANFTGSASSVSKTFNNLDPGNYTANIKETDCYNYDLSTPFSIIRVFSGTFNGDINVKKNENKSATIIVTPAKPIGSGTCTAKFSLHNKNNPDIGDYAVENFQGTAEFVSHTFTELGDGTYTIKVDIDDCYGSVPLYTFDFNVVTLDTSCTPPQVLVNGFCSNPNTKTDYYPLASLPGVGQTDCEPQSQVSGGTTTTCVKTADPNAFGNYLNVLIKIFMGVCAVLAMVMIVMGGVEYMTSELASSKEDGKKRITQAVLGLLIALGAYAILNTINPELLNTSLSNLPQAILELDIHDEALDETKYSTSQLANLAQCPDAPITTGDGVVADPVIANLNIQNKICQRFGHNGQSKIKGIILHRTTGTNPNGAYGAWLQNSGTSKEAAAHFIIDASGNVIQAAEINKYTYSIRNSDLLPGNLKGTLSNTNTISIEVTGRCFIDNLGGQNCLLNDTDTNKANDAKKIVWDSPTPPQEAALHELVYYLLDKYNLTNSNIYAHGETSSAKIYNEASEITQYIKSH
ncbi:MAG: N-acetylmuramoyl-L-alanine amidase [Patescibacteria group bacterium]